MARAEAAVDIIPSYYPPEPHEEAEQAPPQLDAQPNEQAVQAPHPPPQLDAQPNEEAVQVPHPPPQPDPQPNEEAVQALTQLDAQPNEQAVQDPHPPPQPDSQPNEGAEQAPSPHQLPAVDATAPSPPGKAAPPLYPQIEPAEQQPAPSLRHFPQASQLVLDAPLHLAPGLPLLPDTVVQVLSPSPQSPQEQSSDTEVTFSTPLSKGRRRKFLRSLAISPETKSLLTSPSFLAPDLSSCGEILSIDLWADISDQSVKDIM